MTNDSNAILNEFTGKDYEYGFVTNINTEFIPARRRLCLRRVKSKAPALLSSRKV
jgi:hypothetical protein